MAKVIGGSASRLKRQARPSGLRQTHRLTHTISPLREVQCRQSQPQIKASQSRHQKSLQHIPIADSRKNQAAQTNCGKP